MRRSGKAAFASLLSVAAVNAYAGAFVVSGQNNVVIDGKNLSSSDSDCMQVVNSQNITIRNTVFFKCAGVGISIERSSNVKIENSNFEDLNGGVYALDSSTIKVLNNKFKNVSMAGKLNDSRGQFVQFNAVTGAGNEVKNNTGGNIKGSDPEDLFSFYKSSGTASSPIEISGNCVESPVGAYKSESGSGGMIGDNGGSHQYVHDNVFINPGQVGVGVAGGNNIRVEKNKIYGASQPLSNVGLYVWNQSGQACNNITVSGNEVQWTSPAYGNNPSWDGGGCGSISGWSQNNWNANLSGLSCSNVQTASTATPAPAATLAPAAATPAPAPAAATPAPAPAAATPAPAPVAATPAPAPVAATPAPAPVAATPAPAPVAATPAPTHTQNQSSRRWSRWSSRSWSWRGQ